MIFDEATLRKLNALTLISGRVRAGRMRGERRSSKRGASVEFADFRNYVPGDDLRRLDWNIFARLDKPFIKLFEDEEDLSVYVLLDGSKSMDWGRADENKFTYGRRLAAALGAIALGSGDNLSFRLLSGGAAGSGFGPRRGAQHTLAFLSALEPLTPAGTTGLNASLQEFLLPGRRPGIVFLISDLLDPAGFQPGIDALLGRGHQVSLLHLLAPDEIDPQLTGDLKLVDAEFSASEEVTLDPVVLQAYRRQLDGWLEGNRTFLRRRGAGYIHTTTALPWDQFVLRELRRAGVVK